MKASHNPPVETKSMKANATWESDIHASTNMDAWSSLARHSGKYELGGVATTYDSIEELEQIMEQTYLHDHESTISGDIESLAPSTSAASTDVNHSSVNDPTSDRSTTSWITVPSLDGHDRAGGYNYYYGEYPTIPISDGPYRYDHARLGGDVSKPSPLEIWKDTYERHEHIAYRLEKPAKPHKTTRSGRQ